MSVFESFILKKIHGHKPTEHWFTTHYLKINFRKWKVCLNKKRDLRKNAFSRRHNPLIINTPFTPHFPFFRKRISFQAENWHLRNFFNALKWGIYAIYLISKQLTKRGFSQMNFHENPLISGLYTSLFKPDTRLYWKIFPHKPLYIFQQHTSALRRFLRSCPLPANLCNGIGYQFHRASIGIA